MAAYWILKNSDTATLGSLKAVTDCSSEALAEAGTLALCRIFDKNDKRNDSLSINCLLDYTSDKCVQCELSRVYKDLKFTNDIKIKEIRDGLDQLKAPLERFGTLRDKIISHSDADARDISIFVTDYGTLYDFIELHFSDYGSTPNMVFSNDIPDFLIELTKHH